MAHILLHVFPLVVIEKLQARPAQMDVVFRDLVAQHAPGPGIVLRRDVEAACKIAHSRDDDEGHLLLPFAPFDAADFAVRDETAVRPDAVLVEAPRDVAAQRKQVRVVEEHHRLAEDAPIEADAVIQPVEAIDVIEKNEAERDADRQLQRVVRRLRPAPREQRAAASPQILRVLEPEPPVRDEKPGAEQQKRRRNELFNTHGSTLSQTLTTEDASGTARLV